MKIAIGSDHGGYALKQIVCEYLKNLGHEVLDMGCKSEESVDYPDYAFPVCEAVTDGNADRAILICGTGIGMSMCANKVEGIRCALCSEPVSAALTRRHNNANALAVGARIIGVEMAKEIIRTFLETPFDGGRHEKRIDKMMSYSNKYHRD